MRNNFVAGFLVACVLLGTVWAVELTSASNKQVIAELSTRVHQAVDGGWGGTYGTAQVDSLLKAYGWKLGNFPTPATQVEFAEYIWADWHGKIWEPYAAWKYNQTNAANLVMPGEN